MIEEIPRYNYSSLLTGDVPRKFLITQNGSYVNDLVVLRELRIRDTFQGAN